MIGLLLNLDGHETEFANSRAEAIRKLDCGRFDAVFTDFCMPGMKGDQLARAIRQRDVQSPPVVMITGFPPAPVPFEICKVLLKPFDRLAIREALEEVTTR
jgi:CheY-like chemotaxis protein